MSVNLALVLLPGVMGFTLAYLMIPSIIRLATARGVLDFPLDARCMHTVAVPRLGGIAIFCAALFTLAVRALIGWSGVFGLAPADGELTALLLALTIVFATGLVDDVRGLSPRAKLFTQTAAAVIVVTNVRLPSGLGFVAGYPTIPLGAIALPLMVVWIVGVTNAFNLIDGMDGLAGTVALIGLAACIALETRYPANTSRYFMLAVTGAVLAFLVFNRHPARIFLGDSGSMFLGFLLAVQLVSGATDRTGRTYVLVPLFTLALPLMDTAIAIMRRWLRGDPLSRADGRHVHHQILALGISPRIALLILGVSFSLMAVLGLSITFAPPRFTVSLVVGVGSILFVTMFYGLRWLQYHEFLALSGSLASIVRNARIAVKEKIFADEFVKGLPHARTLEDVRGMLDLLVDKTRLLDVAILDAFTEGPGHRPHRPLSLDALPMRLDYPFMVNHGTDERQMLLCLWCARPVTNMPTHTAERLAARVGPALERWFSAQEGAPATSPVVTVRNFRRIPSMHHAR